jgi:hypothetical protein
VIGNTVAIAFGKILHKLFTAGLIFKQTVVVGGDPDIGVFIFAEKTDYFGLFHFAGPAGVAFDLPIIWRYVIDSAVISAYP